MFETSSFPGALPGGGCLVVDVEGKYALTIACLHLSLGVADQNLQLAAVANVLRGSNAWAAMGDFNCGARSAPMDAFCDSIGGHLSRTAPLTFPAWRPRRDYDHIVIGGDLSVTHYQCEAASFSDHRPVSARIVI